ncbi:MAG TPA: glycosyltransferase family 4 protein [Candidatus Limnocylindria bacterium]|nr:glycosyltransferase family 4 protein [Candidatus Limnocylindria bacterium]
MSRHILILNERDLENPRAGGAEIHLFEIFGRLADVGDRVTMLCAGFDGGARDAEIAGITVRRHGNRYTYYARVGAACRRYLRAERPDVLVEAHNKLPFLSPLYTRIPRLVIVHHLFGTTAFRQVPAPVAAVVVVAEALIPWCYRRDRFIAISESSRADLVRRGLPEDAIRVVLPGVDAARYRPAPEARSAEPLVVFVGRVEWYKRLDVLLRALVRVRAAGVPARLVVAGTGAALPRVQSLAAGLGLASAVEMPGFVDEAEKVRLLQGAHVVVQPSEKEGWGLTVVEANACGTPVIAAAVPGLLDSVRDGETGLLVPARDDTALAAALVRVLTDGALRARLSAGALAWARRFSWEAAAAEVGAAIDAACGRAALAAPDVRAARTLSLSLRSPEGR